MKIQDEDLIKDYLKAVRDLYGDNVADHTCAKVEVAGGTKKILIGVPREKPDKNLDMTPFYLPIAFRVKEIPGMITVLKRRLELKIIYEKIQRGEIDITKDLLEEIPS